MLNTETVLKLIEKGFTHDEIMAMESPKTEPEPKTEPPKEEHKTEPPKEEPKTEPPKEEPKTEPTPEPKQDVTGQQILEAILSLGKQVQATQMQGARLPELKDLTADDVVAQMIRPTGGDKA